MTLSLSLSNSWLAPTYLLPTTITRGHLQATSNPDQQDQILSSWRSYLQQGSSLLFLWQFPYSCIIWPWPNCFPMPLLTPQQVSRLVDQVEASLTHSPFMAEEGHNNKQWDATTSYKRYRGAHLPHQARSHQGSPYLFPTCQDHTENSLVRMFIFPRGSLLQAQELLRLSSAMVLMRELH